MNQTLFLSDADGTLLNADGVLPPASQARLGALLKRGVHFSVASARSHFALSQLLGELPLPYPIIEYNGAFITDFQTGEHLVTHSIKTELSVELLPLIEQAGFSPFVTSFNGAEDCLHYRELLNPGMVWYEARRKRSGDPRLRCTPALGAAMEEQVVSLVVMGYDQPGLGQLREELDGRYPGALEMQLYENEYCPGNWWLTIQDPTANKVHAMRRLVSEFTSGIERVVAYGDNLNDIEMLRAASHGIAVGNAKDEVKAVADDVIGHHHDAAVIAHIERSVVTA